MTIKSPLFSASAAISMMPLLCYLILVAAACYTYFALGHWPSYNNPDPKNLPQPWVYTVTVSAVLLGMLMVICGPVFMVIRNAWTKTWKVHVSRNVVLYGIGAALWVVGYFRWVLDGSGLVNWIFD
jgi:hypothetical protein